MENASVYAELDRLVTINQAHVRYLQDEYTSLILHGSFWPSYCYDVFAQCRKTPQLFHPSMLKFFRAWPRFLLLHPRTLQVRRIDKLKVASNPVIKAAADLILVAPEVGAGHAFATATAAVWPGATWFFPTTQLHRSPSYTRAFSWGNL